MTLLKIECPHCRQHFAVKETELNKTFECNTCHKLFSGSDARIVGFANGKGTILFLLTILLLMIMLNIFYLTRLKPTVVKSSEPIITRTVEVAPVITKPEFEDLKARIAALEKRQLELAKKSADVKRAEVKPAESNADVIRSIFIRIGRLESAVGQLQDRNAGPVKD
ncbi:MAG: hypothetical protein LBM70_05755 [Victivallales bacterium]|jgi:hypothetical protein|nr:hypothetical protein [Victivallales bacterium]